MNDKLVAFVLRRMTYYTLRLASHRCVNPSACYAVIDFCVSLLNHFEIYVYWRDDIRRWVVLSSNH